METEGALPSLRFLHIHLVVLCDAFVMVFVPSLCVVSVSLSGLFFVSLPFPLYVPLTHLFCVSLPRLVCVPFCVFSVFRCLVWSAFWARLFKG